MQNDFISRRDLINTLFVRNGRMCPNNDIDNFPITINVKDVKEAIRNAPSAKIGGWIPCSDPPKHNKEVLIFNGKSYSVGYYDGKTWVNAIHPVEWQEIQHG